MFGVPTCGSGSTFVGWSGEAGQCDCEDSHVSPGVGGTLSSSDLAGRLFLVVPAGIPFPVGYVGPIGLRGTLSPSDPDQRHVLVSAHNIDIPPPPVTN